PIATSRCPLVLAAVSTSSVVSASTNARFSTSTPGSIASTPPATPATTPTASAVYVKVRPRPDEFEARAELSRPGEPFVLPTTTLARPAARASRRRSLTERGFSDPATGPRPDPDGCPPAPASGTAGPPCPARRRRFGWPAAGLEFLLMGGISASRLSSSTAGGRRRGRRLLRLCLVCRVLVGGVGAFLGLAFLGRVVSRHHGAAEPLDGFTGLPDRHRHTDLIDRAGLPLAVLADQVHAHGLATGDVVFALALGVRREHHEHGGLVGIGVQGGHGGVRDGRGGDGLLLDDAGAHVLRPLVLLRPEVARGDRREVLQRLVHVAVIEAEGVDDHLGGHIHDRVPLGGDGVALPRLQVAPPEHTEDHQPRHQH